MLVMIKISLVICCFSLLYIGLISYNFPLPLLLFLPRNDVKHKFQMIYCVSEHNHWVMGIKVHTAMLKPQTFDLRSAINLFIIYL